MATSSNSSDDPLADLDSFMDGITELADEVGAKSTKTVHCFFCKKAVEAPLSYKLKSTCPPCFQNMKSDQLREFKPRRTPL